MAIEKVHRHFKCDPHCANWWTGVKVGRNVSNPVNGSRILSTVGLRLHVEGVQYDYWI